MTRPKFSTAGHRDGRKSHPLYPTWQTMIARCEIPTATSYEDYGGRGITVCDRWRRDFRAFVADVGTRPDGHTLDRIDGDRGYEPGNVRWAPLSIQNRNRRRARGEQFHAAKLTDAAVLEIDAALRAGSTQRSLAAAHGVSQSTIAHIAAGKKWGHLTGRTAA